MTLCRSCNGASGTGSAVCENCGLDLAPAVMVHVDQGHPVMPPPQHLEKVRAAGFEVGRPQ